MLCRQNIRVQPQNWIASSSYYRTIRYTSSSRGCRRLVFQGILKSTKLQWWCFSDLWRWIILLCYNKRTVCVFSVALNMSICMRVLLLFVQLYGNITCITIYKGTIAGDKCTLIHICSFEIVPARSLVECAITVTDGDSEFLFYDATERTCSVCHPTPPSIYQLARGQIFYIRGKCHLWQVSVILINTFTASFVRTNMNNVNYISRIKSVKLFFTTNLEWCIVKHSEIEEHESLSMFRDIQLRVTNSLPIFATSKCII